MSSYITLYASLDQFSGRLDIEIYEDKSGKSGDRIW